MLDKVVSMSNKIENQKERKNMKQYFVHRIRI